VTAQGKGTFSHAKKNKTDEKEGGILDSLDRGVLVAASNERVEIVVS